jgi:hypothetical protein
MVWAVSHRMAKAVVITSDDEADATLLQRGQ